MDPAVSGVVAVRWQFVGVVLVVLVGCGVPGRCGDARSDAECFSPPPGRRSAGPKV